MELSIFKAKVKIEFPFFLVLAFCALTEDNYILFLLLYSSLHELGHLIALLIFGGKIDIIALSYFGIALKYKQTLSNFKEAVIISAGPLTSLALYFITKDDVNLILFTLNLLPVYPLDGGRLLRIISYRVSKFVSVITIVLLVPTAIYLIIEYHSYSVLLIVLYLIIYSLGY